jgi:hypothetical protein
MNLYRILGYEDLATGGSLIIFVKHRDLLNDVVLNFMNFFIRRIMWQLFHMSHLAQCTKEKTGKNTQSTRSCPGYYRYGLVGEYTESQPMRTRSNSCQSNSYFDQDFPASIRIQDSDKK